MEIVVPDSLSELVPVLGLANELDATRPRVAFLCRAYALDKTQELDPNSTSSGVRDFKASLEQKINLEDSSTHASRIKETDDLEIQCFYYDYCSALDRRDGEASERANVLFQVLKSRVEKNSEPDYASQGIYPLYMAKMLLLANSPYPEENDDLGAANTGDTNNAPVVKQKAYSLRHRVIKFMQSLMQQEYEKLLKYAKVFPEDHKTQFYLLNLGPIVQASVDLNLRVLWPEFVKKTFKLFVDIKTTEET